MRPAVKESAAESDSIIYPGEVNRFLLAVSFLLLVGGRASAQTTTIDFEFYPGLDGLLGTGDDIPIVAPSQYAQQPEQLTDQFSALGIDFTPTPSINDQNEILNASTFTIPPGHTAPNLLGSLFFAPISGAFSHPVHTISALVGFTGAVEMEIYDAGGASLGTLIGNSTVLSLTSATPIASFEFRASGFGFGVAIDNLEFDALPTGPTLSIAAGTPGGSMTFDFANFTASGQIAVVYGPAGVFPINSGPCAGLVVDLLPLNFPPVTSLILVGADANGDAQLTQVVPGAAAGLSVQAVDRISCGASNALVL